MGNPSFDTLKFSVCDIDEHISEFKLDRFKKRSIQKPGENEIISYELLKSEMPLGLSSFDYFPDQNRAVLECSAKILRENYFEGINLKTLDQFSSSLKILGLKDTWVNDSYVLRCDVTKNIRPTDIDSSLNDLYMLTLNQKYEVKSYRTSIIFSPTAKTSNSRLTFYKKHVELLRAKNKALLKILPSKLVNSSLGILRAERNIRSFKEIRDSFHVKNSDSIGVKFTDIIQSAENPILSMFNRISQVQLPLFVNDPLYENIGKWSELERAYGMDKIIVECGYNLSVIMNLISKYQKSRNPSILRNKYRERIAVLKSVASNKNISSSLEEIRTLLAS